MAIKISRILHAGYVFECEGTKIAFDTIFENPFSVNCYAYPNCRFDLDAVRELRFDAVFISHFHDDHCSLESLKLLNRDTPIFLYCIHDELFELIRQLGFKEVHPLFVNVPVSIGAIEIIPRLALDPDIDSMFHIKAQGLNVLNVVDSWIDPSALERLAEFAPWDMVLWPFQTLRELQVIAPSMAEPAEETLPPEWIEQLQILNPRYIVPSSCQFIHEEWSWYNKALFPVSYARFAKEINAALPRAEVVRMNPGVSFVLHRDSIEPAERLSWVEPVGEQDVDYEYDPDVVPTPTSEIAKHFPALTPQQSIQVHKWCSCLPIEALSFKKPIVWKLRVLDSQGTPREYVYKIGLDNEVTKSPHLLKTKWTTEIAAFKLHSALELGERLSSMYIRVRSEDENEDPVLDPLIQSLCLGEKVQL